MSLEEFENFLCPYCGETNALSVDISGGPHQEFVVDCEVCCAPIVVRLKIRGEEMVSIDVQREKTTETLNLRLPVTKFFPFNFTCLQTLQCPIHLGIINGHVTVDL